MVAGRRRVPDLLHRKLEIPRNATPDLAVQCEKIARAAGASVGPMH